MMMGSKSTRYQRRDLFLSLGVVTFSAIIVLTCSAMRTQKSAGVSRSPVASVEATLSSSVVSSSTGMRSAEAWVEAGGEKDRLWVSGDLGISPEGNPIPGVSRFYEALARLESGLRRDHVRVVWIGDSHTQADIWTHAVRSGLQERFGVGGPGFVHVGWNTYGYRHEQAVLRVGGTWSVQPPTLVSGTQVGDGVFGLGGLRLEPRGADAYASVVVDAKNLPGKGRWDLALRFLHEEARLVVNVDGVAHGVEARAGTLGYIQHLQFETKGPGGTLRVERPSNKLQLFGVVVESAQTHGVVLDTLGLNGGRVRSALAWDEFSWMGELARREPDLVVLAFGTNESSDTNIKKEVHIDRVKRLVGRVRGAAPRADCLIFGPIDRGGERYERVVQRINEAQELAAGELGCAFWSGQRAMGGPGSMRKWAAMAPPLGGGDRIHLHPRGYRKLGQMMVRDLLAGYEAGFARNDGKP